MFNTESYIEIKCYYCQLKICGCKNYQQNYNVSNVYVIKKYDG